MTRTRCIPAIIMAMLAPALAWAEQQITFNVPVQLSSLHKDVKTFSVQCTVRSKANPMAGHGFDRTDLPVDKAYSGTVSVTVKVGDSAAAQVDSWDCSIFLFAPQGCTPAPDSPLAACKTKSGAPLVTKVSGKL
ncbi:MAG: hypothetical protein IT480_02565 [Gammaproteobacteria bacterium]|nr:hypothetical protein [Gammaproteobacteria bacterium]